MLTVLFAGSCLATFSKVCFYVPECFSCMHFCAPCVCLVPREVRRGPWIPLELELQRVMHCHVDAKKQSR